MEHYRSINEIAKKYGVTHNAAKKWTESPGFPSETRHGYPREAVIAWVDAKDQRQAERAAATRDKQEKTRLECERLRVVVEHEKERLEQTRIETRRLRRKLVQRDEVEKDDQRRAALVRGAVESWRAHETAKNPGHRALVEGLAESALAAMRAALGASNETAP